MRTYKIILAIFSIGVVAPALAFAPVPVAKCLSVPQSSTPTSKLLAGPLDNLTEDSSEDEVKAAMEEFKKQNQIKAFGFLAVTFATFVYFKLQFDIDPSGFVGSK